LLKLMSEREKKEMYDHIEKCGNIRIERFAFAFVANDKERNKQKHFVRLTGKANHAWVVEMFKTLSDGKLDTKQMRDAEGTPITVLQTPRREPLIVMIGNTDVVIAGYDQFDAKHEDLLPEIL